MSKYINMEKVSDYGKENNRIDYGYLAKQEVDNMILANQFEQRLYDDLLELESGYLYTEDAEYEDEMVDIYQWYIIDGRSAKRLEKYDELVFYDTELDIYVWGITHWGTGWDYVLTDVEIEEEIK